MGLPASRRQRGKGTMTQAVWKLKVVWDHVGTGTVRSRNIHQQIERAEKRLSKLNTVEATRRTGGANDALKRAMRTCSGGGEITQAAQAIETQETGPAEAKLELNAREGETGHGVEGLRSRRLADSRPRRNWS
jgi:hypothetical protein